MIVVLMMSITIYFFVQKSVTKDDTFFVIGTAAGYAPFVSVNSFGEYEGFDIDVAKAVANQLGKKLVIKDLGCMASLFMALDQGMIDVIIWGISITQDRLAKVAMIHYYGTPQIAHPLIFWKTIPANIKTLDDMACKIVCVEPASSHAAVVAKFPKIQTMPTEKIDDALFLIQYGKADAAFVEPAIAQKFKNKYSEIKMVDVPFPVEDQVQGGGIVIKKNNKQLIEKVFQAVEQLKLTGVIAELEQRWEIPS